MKIVSYILICTFVVLFNLQVATAAITPPANPEVWLTWVKGETKPWFDTNFNTAFVANIENIHNKKQVYVKAVYTAATNFPQNNATLILPPNRGHFVLPGTELRESTLTPDGLLTVVQSWTVFHCPAWEKINFSPVTDDGYALHDIHILTKCVPVNASIPTPAALLLGIMGSSMVGYLRVKKLCL